MSDSERYVIGMDSSTQSVKVIAWTADGTPRAEGRAPHHILTPAPERAEQDPEEWWSAACTALRAVTAAIDPGRIDGLAISDQRETMVLVDAQGRAPHPATLWMDRRAEALVPILDRELGEGRLHAISGRPLSAVPCVHRLRYLREHEPRQLDEAALILSVHDFLVQRLTGEAHATWTSADPFGIFDINTHQWSREVLDHLGIPLSKLPPVHRPGTLLARVSVQAAAATGLRAGTPVYGAGGDGHCAGLGVNAVSPRNAYLNLGTAVVGGAWAPQPALSRFWRTMISPSGEGYFLESCQLAGAFFVNWLIDNFAGDRADPAIFTRLEAEAAALPVGAGGVSVSSYLLGCMDPYWDEDARAAFTGMGPEAGIGHLYRASLEAITLGFTRSLAQMREHGAGAERVFVIGGGANSRLWMQMVADAAGLPAVRSLSNEASALGAGMSAAVGAGWHPDFATAAAAMSRQAEQIDPDPAAADAWAGLAARQDTIYRALRAARTPSSGE